MSLHVHPTKHKQTLKKQRLGPYVIFELLSSDVVRLATLVGEQMAMFTHVNQLKKLEGPLTQKMLDQIHRAKTKKETLELLKQ